MGHARVTQNGESKEEAKGVPTDLIRRHRYSLPPSLVPLFHSLHSSHNREKNIRYASIQRTFTFKQLCSAIQAAIRR